MAMLSLPPSVPTATVRPVLSRFRRRKTLPAKRLSWRLHLIQDLCFELLAVVDIFLELEQRFYLPIPDEVGFDAIEDFVDYVASEPRRGFCN